MKFQGNTLTFSNDVSVWDYYAFPCRKHNGYNRLNPQCIVKRSGIIKWHVLWNDLIWAQCSCNSVVLTEWWCERIWRCAAVLHWQYYRHITAASLWLDQVSAAQDVVRRFILRLIHFLLNCSPNLRCNLSCPCESYCLASLEKMRLCCLFSHRA